jgi:hypothetical protein
MNTLTQVVPFERKTLEDYDDYLHNKRNDQYSENTITQIIINDIIQYYDFAKVYKKRFSSIYISFNKKLYDEFKNETLLYNFYKAEHMSYLKDDLVVLYLAAKYYLYENINEEINEESPPYLTKGDILYDNVLLYTYTILHQLMIENINKCDTLFDPIAYQLRHNRKDFSDILEYKSLLPTSEEFHNMLSDTYLLRIVHFISNTCRCMPCKLYHHYYFHTNSSSWTTGHPDTYDINLYPRSHMFCPYGKACPNRHTCYRIHICQDGSNCTYSMCNLIHFCPIEHKQHDDCMYIHYSNNTPIDTCLLFEECCNKECMKSHHAYGPTRDLCTDTEPYCMNNHGVMYHIKNNCMYQSIIF